MADFSDVINIETCAECDKFACKDLKAVFDYYGDAKKKLMDLKKNPLIKILVLFFGNGNLQG
jgi:hypothetical protein